VDIGLKERAADGYTSHLLDARVQFLVEMILVEVTTPDMTRPGRPARLWPPSCRLALARTVAPLPIIPAKLSCLGRRIYPGL